MVLSQEGLGALVHSQSDRLQGWDRLCACAPGICATPGDIALQRCPSSQVMLLSQTPGARTTSLPVLSEMLCRTVIPQKDKQASGDRSPHKHPTLWSQTLWLQGCRGGQRSFIQVPIPAACHLLPRVTVTQGWSMRLLPSCSLELGLMLL